MSFVHLHVHDGLGSLLDGGSPIEQYIKKASEDGQPAIASTNHGNLAALPDLEKYSRAYGVKMIPGCELYMARRSVTERPASRNNKNDESEVGKKYHHLTTLALNQTGYQNLIELSSRSFLDESAFYFKPRIDFNMLADHSEGLLVTSSCLGGVVLQDIMHGNMAGAEESVQMFVDIFGRDRFCIEVQDHDIPEQHKTNPVLFELAKKYKLRVVATADAHYLDDKDAPFHDALLCSQTSSTIASTNRFKFNGHGHYLKTAQEIRWDWRQYPEVCDNTLWVAEQVEDITIINSGSYHLPKFPSPEEFSGATEYLRHLVFEGAYKRISDVNSQVLERIEYELKVFDSANLSDYFLILWDVVQFCKSNGWLTGPGRGSSCGTIVAYCLGITHINPLDYDLPFERFYNPDRKGLADIDLDVEPRSREPVIKYLTTKYGNDSVCQIITFSEIKSRSAIKDAARVLGHPPFKGDELSKLLPDMLFGKDTPIEECLKESPSPKYRDTWKQAENLRNIYKTSKEDRHLLDIAAWMEGLTRSTSIHAAAVVVSPEKLTNYLPIQRRNPREPVTTAYGMGEVENLGLLKLDLLGLRTLSVISYSLEWLDELGIDPYDIPLDDQKTYDMLSAGNSIGVFQLESAPMRELLTNVKPNSIHDLAAVVALYRPGPMGLGLHTEYWKRKHGLSPIESVHPEGNELLADTYSIVLYQEDMMRVARHFAGYSGGDSDELRKACSKKINLDKHKDKFINAVIENGYGEKVARDWWAVIEPFGDYAFSKNHAVPYAYLAYLTGYLKANYPTQYMAALLTSLSDSLEKAGPILYECHRMGIEIALPDVNKSGINFTPVGNRILFGLGAIKGVTSESVSELFTEREKGGFESYDDLRKRVRPKVLNKKVMAALASAGALDCFGDRGGLLSILDASIASARREQAEAEAGLMDLLSFIDYKTVETVIPAVGLADAKIRDLERTHLGIAITAHPLRGWESVIESRATATVAELEEKVVVKICGSISSVTEKRSKRGNLIGLGTIEDLSGSVEFLVFPQVWEKSRVAIDQVVCITGKLSEGKVLVDNIEALDPNLRHAQPKEITLHLTPNDMVWEKLSELELLVGSAVHAGSCSVLIDCGPDGVVKLSDEYRINPNDMAFRHEVRKIFGKDVFK